MKINPTIFREYDIRGIAGVKFSPEAIQEYEKWYGTFPGVTLTPDSAKAIGQAYGTIIRKEGGKGVVIGHEIRPFAEELKGAFISGVRQAGCNVTDLGVSLTPIVYFNTARGNYDGGVNVTGSHNFYFYNCFKLMKKNVWPVFGQAIQEMREMIEKEDVLTDTQGTYKTIDGYKTYEEYFLNHIKLARKLRIVIDSGNGSAGVFTPGLFRELGCEVIELYSQPDASFPNHIPDPEQKQNYKELVTKVKEEKADLGIAFDADGDRVGFATEDGELVDSEMILLILTKDVLKRNPGKKILFDVKSSQLLEELIPSFGGIPLMHQTGHAPIKETLRKDQNIILGGEVSGHFYFVENYFKIDDGPFAAGRLLEIISNQTNSFSSLVKEFPQRIRPPEFKLICADDKKFAVAKKIQQDLSKQFSAITIDGVRIQVSKTGWGLIRASNTSPYFTVRAEGESEQEVIKIKNILADELEKFPEIVDRLNRKEVATLTGKLGWV